MGAHLISKLPHSHRRPIIVSLLWHTALTTEGCHLSQWSVIDRTVEESSSIKWSVFLVWIETTRNIMNSVFSMFGSSHHSFLFFWCVSSFKEYANMFRLLEEKCFTIVMYLLHKILITQCIVWSFKRHWVFPKWQIMYIDKKCAFS